MMLPGFQAEGMHIFLADFFVNPDVFFHIFPNIHNFIHKYKMKRILLMQKSALTRNVNKHLGSFLGLAEQFL